MASSQPLYHTADMVRALTNALPPERQHWPRYETVYGELLVSPAPRLWHQEMVTRLVLALGTYLEHERAGYVLTSPSDISWGRDDVLVQPDVFVIPHRPTPTLQWGDVTGLLLAVEVLSPGNARRDRFTKRRLYQDQGVPLYWIVDADAHAVEVWTPDAHLPRVERDRLVWAPAGATSSLVVELGALFQPG